MCAFLCTFWPKYVRICALFWKIWMCAFLCAFWPKYVRIWVQNYWPLCPFPPSTFKWLQSLCQENSEKYSEIKQNVFESLKNAILPGLCEANVVHRDIKLDNFIYLPRSDSIVICDFGVSVIKNDEMKFGPRGKVMDREHKQFWNSTQAGAWNFHEIEFHEFFHEYSHKMQEKFIFTNNFFFQTAKLN